MSDREMREFLREVIADIDAGRVQRAERVQRPCPGRRVLRYLGPPLLAASLGMVGCGEMEADPSPDAIVDAAYMAPFDGTAPLDGMVDAAYMAPFDGTAPLDGMVDAAYMAPFDSPDGGDEDAGM